MELLKSLYGVHSPSNKEDGMRTFLLKELANKKYGGASSSVDEHGNILITKGVSTSYPCAVAHIDEVHNTGITHVLELDGALIGLNSKLHSQNGIGADDKNGIWCALKLLEENPIMKVALFVGEEVGCIGSGKVNMAFFDDCQFVLEADRKGGSDFINSIAGMDLCSKEFLEDAKIESFGYKATFGMMTDVQKLKARGLKVSCCNISCGYYEPHTKNEYTIFSELTNCLELMRGIVALGKEYPHEYVAPVYTPPTYGGTSAPRYGTAGYSRSLADDDAFDYRNSYAVSYFDELERLIEMMKAEKYDIDVEKFYKKNQRKFVKLFERDFCIAASVVQGEIFFNPLS